MTVPVVLFAALAIGYALVSRRLRGTAVTGPMLFTAAGLAVGGSGLGLVTVPGEGRTGTVLLEASLVLVLFSDSLAISRTQWRRERLLPLRLLAIGLPLSILAGWGVALVLLPGVAIWQAAVLATALAPTDAALGQAVVSDRRVPALVRHGLNVESGLNDGLALPFLAVFLTLAATESGGIGAADPVVQLLRAVVGSSVVAVAVAWPAARLLLWSRGRRWSERHWRAIALLALAAATYQLAEAIHGSGFIAVWVCGLTVGTTIRDAHADLVDVGYLTEELADLGTALSFLFFGALYLGPALAHGSWRVLGYAVLSLTVIRMVPVAVAVLGRGLAAPSVLYLGWFGPRGLASLIFAGVIVEAELPGPGIVVPTVMLTVGLSVVLHGATAAWGAARYGRWYGEAVRRQPGLPESAAVDGAAERTRSSPLAQPDEPELPAAR